jgi:excisionase family DNA binding protein
MHVGMMTPEEVAAEIRVTRRTVYEWLRSGKLLGLRAGRSWRVRREDLNAFLNRGPAPQEETEK